jgi:hypothetical protein
MILVERTIEKLVVIEKTSYSVELYLSKKITDKGCIK